MHPNVHYSTIYNSQAMEANSMPINREMDKDVVYICVYIVKYYSAMKRDKIVPLRDMDGSRDCHIERNKSEREKYHILISICEI